MNFLGSGTAYRALMVLGFGLGALSVFPGVLNHDDAWYLHLAGRMWAGERLYVDLIETNPPLIVWLNVPPMFLARSLGISPITAFRVMVLGLVAFSLELIRQTTLLVWPDRRRDRGALLLGCLFILLWLPGYDFGQREHLMLALFLPYLTMAWGRATGGRPSPVLTLAVGLSAGLGLALKPHFVLPWLAIETYLAARLRDWRIWLRPEALAVISVGVFYAVAVLVLHPEYLRLMAWAGPLYSASGRSSLLSMTREPGTIVTAVALLGFLAMRRQGNGGEGPRLILVADLGFLAIAWLQNKGYPYHFYPPRAMAVLVVGQLALSGGPGVAPVLMRGTLAVLVLSVGVARGTESLVWGGRPGQSDTLLGKMIRAAKDDPDGGPVFTFSTAVGAGFPMVNYTGRGWASRHPALWFLPAFHPRGFESAPASMGQTERFLFDSVVDELLTKRPTLMFVDETENHPAFQGRRFRYLEYYSLDPRFARFLQDYEPSTKVGDFRVYRLRRRVGSG